MNQSSSFTSLNSNEYLSSSFSYWTEQKKRLIHELEQGPGRAREEDLVQLRTKLEQTNQMLTRHSSEQQSFIQQKEKNEKIVKDCKELLSKLEE